MDVDVGGLSLLVQPVPVHPQVIDPVERPVVVVQVRLPQRPRVSHRELLEVVADGDELIVVRLEPLGNGSLPKSDRTVSDAKLGQGCLGKLLPFERHFCPPETPVQETVGDIASREHGAVFGDELAILPLVANLLDLLL